MAVTQAEVLDLFTQVSAIKDSDQILLIKANGNGTVTAAKITAELLKRYLIEGYEMTVDSEGYICIGGVRTQTHIEIPDGVGVFDEQGRYIITNDGKSYLVSTTELVAPAAPTVETTELMVVSGYASIVVTHAADGSTMEYSLDGTVWGSIVATVSNNVLRGTVNIPSGFTDENADSVFVKTLNLYVRAKKNGEYSVGWETPIVITINRQVKPGSVTWQRSGNDNEYSEYVTVTYTASTTPDSTSYIQEQNAPRSQMSGSVEQRTYTSSIGKEYLKVITEHEFMAANTAYNNSAIVVGTPKMYWAVVESVPSSESTIKNYWTALEQKTFPSVTLPSSGVQGKKLILAYNKATVGNRDVSTVTQAGFPYEKTFDTCGTFRLCIVSNLAASAAGQTFIFS